VVVAPWVAGEGDVVLVDVHGDAELAAGALREADVVEVRVREHQGPDLIGAPAEPPERLVQRRPRARNAGVDDREPVVGADDVPVRPVVLDAVDARGGVDLDHGSTGCHRRERYPLVPRPTRPQMTTSWRAA
jgi:hypothetical protein